MLECHYGVDILDEWAILPRLARFPVVIAPEQSFMSEKMVDALKEYVGSGGKLLVSGAKAFERFGAPFLGVGPGRLVEKAIYYVPAGDGAAPIASAYGDWLKPQRPKSSPRLEPRRFSMSNFCPTRRQRSIASVRAQSHTSPATCSTSFAKTAIPRCVASSTMWCGGLPAHWTSRSPRQVAWT